MLAVMSGGGNEYRSGTGRNALQQGAEIFAADVAGEPQIGRAVANPLADTGLALGVIVVDGIVLVEIVFGLGSTEGVTHGHHAGSLMRGASLLIHRRERQQYSWLWG